ncbi:MAG: transcription-repair coupling factor [FCB group bacterium]|nr:transcription-repair coupling factor [FCB group bacterium]
MKTTTSFDVHKIKHINSLWKEYPPFHSLNNFINGQDFHTTVTGLNGSSLSFLLKNLTERTNKKIIIITESTGYAHDLYNDLIFLLEPAQVGHFPSRQILPYDFKAPVGEIMGQRISALAALVNNSLSVMVCPIRAFLEPTITFEDLQAHRLALQIKEEINLEHLVKRLIKLGFRRVSNVEEMGDFALRGGLIDFFSPGEDYPIRVELYGDEIETIRRFDVTTQRTVEKIEQVNLLPKREIFITQQNLEKYLNALPSEDANYIRDRYLNDPELPGLEWLATMFGIKQGTLTDYFQQDSLIFLDNEKALQAKAEAIVAESQTLYEHLKKHLSHLPPPHKYYHQITEVFASLNKFKKIDVIPFKGGKKEIIDFDCQPHPSFGSRLDLLNKAIKEYNTKGLTYFIAVNNEGQASRLKELLEDKDDFLYEPAIEVADIKSGFVCPKGGFAILTDHEIFNRYHQRKHRKKFKEGVALADYSHLNKGDYVVHTDYGIASYQGLVTLQVDHRKRDCLLLRYAEGDKLYVPIEEFNRVSKYSGKDSAPVLTHLGGATWEKLKKKTKKAIINIASDLLKLYATRKSNGGHSFGADTVWLKQLESSFIYEETPDQRRAIEDVKKDMTESKSMDRLICGDVGFGKTEVAIRAAFKAIESGKQVAVLVPTTILAQQHFHTFSERFKDFPFRVEMLSRFRTRKEQQHIIDDLAVGKVDLIIGTHRLFSQDIFIKDLGLLIIDEEHRFGVRHKEKLRQMKTSVDTLSMTATPIPRTLQMSLTGVRDMSLIATSPKDRLPIITEVIEFDPAVIATTILREIKRGGQVFFVHNRVQTIDAMHNYLKKIVPEAMKKIVPEAKIAVAHGQMHEKSLEGIMLAFLAQSYNVLLCTSIIESGLDIPSANTIIINRADRFGLAQLYQLRGRVGRSTQRAYAYLITPPIRRLKADAIKRLRAIEAHSDLGSGFALAMRDLEIRGAGTILGAKQSGFIEQIGFDLYNKLLEETIAELKGEEVNRPIETKLETNMEMLLDDEYINDRHQKVDIYRRLADCRKVEEVEKIRNEVTDRFGLLPPSAVNLFEGTKVKILASHLGMEKVKIKNGIANLFYHEKHQLQRAEVQAVRQATDCPIEFSLIGTTQIIIDLNLVKQNQRLSYFRDLLNKMISAIKN